jgi:FixJ family two-component response regulator
MKPMVHVVDDDESLRTALLRLLKGSGFEATGYRSTGEFLVHHPAMTPEALLDAVARALARDATARVERHEQAELRAAFSRLSERERQVFDLIVSGQLNKQIAARFGLTERTVKAQRASIMMKLGANSVAELGGSQNGCARWAKNPADRVAWTVALTRKGRSASSPSSC